MKSEMPTFRVYADTTVTAGPFVYAYYAACDRVPLSVAAAEDLSTLADETSAVGCEDGEDIRDKIRRTIADLFMLLILSLWLN